MIVTTLLALVAQASLAMASPLADIHYHSFGPLQVESAGSHGASAGSPICPECAALQSMAVPASPPDVLRSSRELELAPLTAPRRARPVLRTATRFARAPPPPRGEIL